MGWQGSGADLRRRLRGRAWNGNCLRQKNLRDKRLEIGYMKWQLVRNSQKLMKKPLLTVALGLALAGSAFADFSVDYTPNAAIPDGSTIGMSDSHILSVPFNTINDINVRVNVSGGFNGDLYAYLVHNSG